MINPPRGGVGSIVRVGGERLHCLVSINGTIVTLDDGTKSGVEAVNYPTYHPNRGLD